MRENPSYIPLIEDLEYFYGARKNIFTAMRALSLHPNKRNDFAG